MPKQNGTILTAEQEALETYEHEHEKMADVLRKKISKHTRKENLVGGALGGAALGIIFGAIIGDSKARIPSYDETNKIVEYKMDLNKLGDFMLKSIVIMMLVTLSASGVKTISDSTRDRNWADKLAISTFKQYFKKPLNDYKPDEKNIPHLSARTARAAALVINNIPESELERLRSLAVFGLAQNKDGYYSIRDEYIAAASQIISNFIQYNPEIKRNIQRIMRGDQPSTYFLASSLNQKTK